MRQLQFYVTEEKKCKNFKLSRPAYDVFSNDLRKELSMMGLDLDHNKRKFFASPKNVWEEKRRNWFFFGNLDFYELFVLVMHEVFPSLSFIFVLNQLFLYLIFVNKYYWNFYVCVWVKYQFKSKHVLQWVNNQGK